eukprot:8456027-Alexandrium_andersonii.AAC.1
MHCAVCRCGALSVVHDSWSMACCGWRGVQVWCASVFCRVSGVRWLALRAAGGVVGCGGGVWCGGECCGVFVCAGGVWLGVVCWCVVWLGVVCLCGMLDPGGASRGVALRRGEPTH